MTTTQQQQDAINKKLGAQVVPGWPTVDNEQFRGTATPFASPGGPADLPPTLGAFLMEQVARRHGGRTLTQQAEDRVGADRAMASGFGARAGGFVPASERAGLQGLGQAQVDSRARAGLGTNMGTPGEGMYRDVNRWPKSTQPQYNNPARQQAQNHVYDTTGLVSGERTPTWQQDRGQMVDDGPWQSVGTSGAREIAQKYGGPDERVAPAAGRGGSSPSAMGLSTSIMDLIKALPVDPTQTEINPLGEVASPVGAAVGFLPGVNMLPSGIDPKTGKRYPRPLVPDPSAGNFPTVF